MMSNKTQPAFLSGLTKNALALLPCLLRALSYAILRQRGTNPVSPSDIADLIGHLILKNVTGHQLAPSCGTSNYQTIAA